MYSQTCINNSPYFIQFQHGQFPAGPTLSRFIANYIEFFHQTLPFLHLPTFDIKNSHWLLLLAMAAMGSQYHSSSSYTRPMHEFLRRAICVTEGKGAEIPRFVMIQVKLLNCVGLMYSGWDDSFRGAKAHQTDLIEFCLGEWKDAGVMTDIRISELASNEEGQINERWNQWHQTESVIRTGYCIWVCFRTSISIPALTFHSS